MKSWLATLIVSSSLVANAEVTPVYKGNAVPFDGFLFTREEADRVRVDRLERDAFKEKSESLVRSLELQSKNTELASSSVDLLLKRNDQLAGSLRDAQSVRNVERVLWFVLGVAVSGVAVYGAKTISSR